MEVVVHIYLRFNLENNILNYKFNFIKDRE